MQFKLLFSRITMRNSVLWGIFNLLFVLAITSHASGRNFCFWYSNDVVCQNRQFRCFDGEKCISRDRYCNGVADCSDESDEEYCINRTEPTTVTEESSPAENQVSQWIKNQKKESRSAGKWGSNVDKLALTLYFADDPAFNNSLPIKEEMAYELNIQVLSQLASVKLENIPSTDLAFYVNAFLITCINPRKFHGLDIIQELRNRIDKENFTNPYVFLALCNAGEKITESDKNKLIDIFDNKQRIFWTGTQAVAVMALACANNQPENEVDAETLRKMTLELKQQQYSNGTVVNLPTTALVLQALISTHSEPDPDNFDEVKAFQELLRNQKDDGSFGNLLNTFFVTPVLTCKTLLDINSNQCQRNNINDEKSEDGKVEQLCGERSNGRDYFAKRLNSHNELEKYYLVQYDGSEIYPRDENNKELYIVKNDHPVFAKDSDREEYYATMINTDGEIVEYLPEISGQKFFIKTITGEYKIPFNLTTKKPLYNKNKDGDEIYEKDCKNNEYYAYHKKLNTGQIYAKDKNHKEVSAVQENERPFYAKDEKGNEIYPKDSEGNEYYLKFELSQIYAKTFKKAEYVAKDKYGSGFYAWRYKGHTTHP